MHLTTSEALALLGNHTSPCVTYSGTMILSRLARENYDITLLFSSLQCNLDLEVLDSRKMLLLVTCDYSCCPIWPIGDVLDNCGDVTQAEIEI